MENSLLLWHIVVSNQINNYSFINDFKTLYQCSPRAAGAGTLFTVGTFRLQTMIKSGFLVLKNSWIPDLSEIILLFIKLINKEQHVITFGLGCNCNKSLIYFLKELNRLILRDSLYLFILYIYYCIFIWIINLKRI